MPEVYAQCGGWIPASIIDRTLRRGYCHAHSSVEGWPVLDVVDWKTASYL